ncbi:MAG: DNA adenine methylase [Nitrospira sp.]|nr:DNA adenine methylase [Nitrospira sp.]
MFTSPLRYPGGKGKLAPFVMFLIEKNGLLDGEYVEPYAGGAAIAFSLLFHEYVTDVHINDINEFIFSFWHSVLNETDELCRLIQDTPVNMKTWETQRAIQSTPLKHTKLECGFSTFFMNRTTRSGILEGGVIGGKNQDGVWKLDARYNKRDLISRIKKIACYANRIHLYNMDAVEFMNSIMPNLSKKTLVYLDPPYYAKGKDLYVNFYKPEDHSEIASMMSRQNKHKWIVSYDNVPAIADLYKNNRSITYSLNYSAANRYAGSEIMIFSDNSFVPDIVQPANLAVINEYIKEQVGGNMATAAGQRKNLFAV